MIRIYLSTSILLVFMLGQAVYAQDEHDATKGNTGSEAKAQYRGGACNFDEYTQAVLHVQKRRKERLLTAAEFAKQASVPGTIILDARSELSFELLHVTGSIDLPYTNFGIPNLEKIIPSESTKILIYCRNNIANESFSGVESSAYSQYIVPKERAVGLNVPVAVTLFIYGYKNVWELDEIVDPEKSPIEFEWTPKYKAIANSDDLKRKRD